jgi:hypothetical protein
VNGFASALSLITEIIGVLVGATGYGVGMWFLALVFGWSGISKLRRPALAARAIVDFGVVRRARPGLGISLGVAELSLALSLAVGLFPRLFICIAAVLLWFFVLLIARSLRSGDRFACFCFGESGSRISGSTLARTAVLALGASMLALAPTPSAVQAGSTETNAFHAMVALSLLGTIVLASYIPALLRSSSEPSGVHTTVKGVD